MQAKEGLARERFMTECYDLHCTSLVPYDGAQHSRWEAWAELTNEIPFVFAYHAFHVYECRLAEICKGLLFYVWNHRYLILQYT